MNPVNLFMQDNELKNQGIYMFCLLYTSDAADD